MTNRLWKFLTSLKVTVVLLLLCTLLVFLGTIAQVHEGLWEAQERWFKSFVVFRRSDDVWWVPAFFPGGYTLGFGLLINLIAAHIKRFQFTWKKAGIHLTHLGIILLLAGQLLTDLLARESFLSFAEGEKRSFSEAHRSVELVVNTSAPDAPGQDRVISFAETNLKKKRPLRGGGLPFELRILQYGENAEVLSHESVREAGTQLLTALATLESNYGSAEGLIAQAEKAAEVPGRSAVWKAALQSVGETDPDLVAAAKRVVSDSNREAGFREDLKRRFREQMLEAFQKMPRRQAASERAQAMAYVAKETASGRPPNLEALPAAATHGAGPRVLLLPLPAARGMDERNFPYVSAEVLHEGRSIGTWLLSPWLNPQEINVAGKVFQLALRSERYVQPFSLELLKTTHEVYTGTDIPKNFQSRVRIENPQTQEKREVDISMNNPLRYGGLTFYQSQMGRTEPTGGKGTSVLQVVRNPGWITPYLGCVIVALGMLWQFFYHLVGFLTRPRITQASSPSVTSP
ncbi:MAG: hypothetical protein RLZZ399_2216 [Verrucomicrobiota bacterium]|jgi:hypothetical protein